MCKQDGRDDDSFAFAFTLLLENYKMWLLGFIFLFGVYWVMPKKLLDLWIIGRANLEGIESSHQHNLEGHFS